jgi:hypothetical protein
MTYPSESSESSESSIPNFAGVQRSVLALKFPSMQGWTVNEYPARGLATHRLVPTQLLWRGNHYCDGLALVKTDAETRQTKVQAVMTVGHAIICPHDVVFRARRTVDEEQSRYFVAACRYSFAGECPVAAMGRQQPTTAYVHSSFFDASSPDQSFDLALFFYERNEGEVANVFYHLLVLNEADRAALPAERSATGHPEHDVQFHPPPRAQVVDNAITLGSVAVDGFYEVTGAVCTTGEVPPGESEGTILVGMITTRLSFRTAVRRIACAVSWFKHGTIAVEASDGSQRQTVDLAAACRGQLPSPPVPWPASSDTEDGVGAPTTDDTPPPRTIPELYVRLKANLDASYARIDAAFQPRTVRALNAAVDLAEDLRGASVRGVSTEGLLHALASREWVKVDDGTTCYEWLHTDGSDDPDGIYVHASDIGVREWTPRRRPPC